MDETETDGTIEFEESSIWWPSSMGEVIVALPAVEVHAQYSNYFVPVFPNTTPPPSLGPSQGDVLSGFKTRCCDETDQDKDEVCCICLDNLYRGSVTSLDCGHEFHPDCIMRWLVRGQNFCPLCRSGSSTGAATCTARWTSYSATRRRCSRTATSWCGGRWTTSPTSSRRRGGATPSRTPGSRSSAAVGCQKF